MFNNNETFSSMPDLYKILECPEDATPEYIKKQYRKMSLNHHPDKNLGDASAEEKFKTINMAYEILSDPSSKSKYDNRNNQPNIPRGMNNTNGNMDDIIKMFFSTNSNNPFGGKFPFNMNVNGSPGGNVHIFRNGQPVHMTSQDSGIPPVIQKKVSISFDTAYHGGQVPIEIERWSAEISTTTNPPDVNQAESHEKNEIRKTEQETVYLEIPKGIDTNEVISIKGKGNVKNNVYGDVKVIIVVEKHDQFKREGLNLIYAKTISFKESICGFESIIRHVNGKQLRYKSDAGQVVRDGTIKTIPGLGMMRNNHVGSLIVKLQIDYSKKLTEDQITKLNEIL